jgi:hypothetical protein
MFEMDLDYDDCCSIDEYDNTKMILGFLRLKPMGDNEIGGYFQDPNIVR